MKTPQEYLSCRTDLPYKALIFDCDGTLADTLPVHYRVWSEALQQFEVEMTEEWYYQHAGLSTGELIRTLNETFEHQLDAHAITIDRLRRYQALIDDRSFARYVKEIPTVAEIARSSYGEVPMAVASGGEREIVEAALDAIGLRDYFDTVVTLNDVANGKPAPDVFLLAAEQLSVAPSDCRVYEDSEGGLEAARRAGMPAIDVRMLQQSTAQTNAFQPSSYPAAKRKDRSVFGTV